VSESWRWLETVDADSLLDDDWERVPDFYKFRGYFYK
jgi:hypothetical protein